MRPFDVVHEIGDGFAKRLRRRRPRPETSGIWTKCSSGSGACNIIYGVPWIRTASCSTSSFSHVGTPGRKAIFSAVAEGLKYVPRVIVTDKLRSYGVAHRKLMPRLNIDKADI